MLYILNLYSAICQLYLNKKGKKNWSMISQTFLWRRHTYSQHVLIHKKELNVTDHEFSSVQLLSCVQLLQPHEPQHVKPPCPSPTPGVHTNSCPLSW